MVLLIIVDLVLADSNSRFAPLLNFLLRIATSFNNLQPLILAQLFLILNFDSLTLSETILVQRFYRGFFGTLLNPLGHLEILNETVVEVRRELLVRQL